MIGPIMKTLELIYKLIYIKIQIIKFIALLS